MLRVEDLRETSLGAWEEVVKDSEIIVYLIGVDLGSATKPVVLSSSRTLELGTSTRVKSLT